MTPLGGLTLWSVLVICAWAGVLLCSASARRVYNWFAGGDWFLVCFWLGVVALDLAVIAYAWSRL